jgi:GNAT superfamily N-acetyltransferase
MDNEDIKIEFIPKDKQGSDYNWANILIGNARAGKARCLIEGDRLIIYSINVYQDFEGRGFGKKFVDMAKLNFDEVVADRVRNTAIGFWEKMGFEPDEKRSNWIWRKK